MGLGLILLAEGLVIFFILWRAGENAKEKRRIEAACWRDAD